MDSDIRTQPGSDVQYIEAAYFVSPRLLRIILGYLGDHAKVLAQRNGCAPGRLVAAQHAVAETLAAADSRQRQCDSVASAEIVASGYEIGTGEAAAALGITAGGVRWLIDHGHLISRKVGRQHMVTKASIEQYLRSRMERSA